MKVKEKLSSDQGNLLLKYKILPPILPQINTSQPFTHLFSQYLKFVINFSSDNIHPISAHIRAVAISGFGAIEARSLTLCIAIEGILKHVVNIKNHLSEEEIKWVESVKEFITNSEGSSHLKNRLMISISKLNEVSATSRLIRLEKDNIITKNQIKAWKELRNKLRA